MLNLSGKTLSAGKITIGHHASCQRESRNEVGDTYQLRKGGGAGLRTRSSERGRAWIITIVVVNDTLRYHTREVVGGDRNDPPDSTKSRALYTDDFDMVRDVDGAAWGSGALVASASTAATRTTLLTSRISSRWSH